MKLSDLAVDNERLNSATWVTEIPDCDDLKVMTRGLNNADYKRLMDSKINALKPKERRKGIKNETSKRLVTECLVETCLVDWENLDVPFSKEKALELLCDPRYEPLRDACLYAAQQVAEDAREANEEDEKNSSTGSGGNSPGVGTGTSSTT